MNTELPVLAAQQRIHEKIAAHAPLRQVLCEIVDWILMQLPGSSVSLMAFDDRTETLSAMPCNSISAPYFEKLQNVPLTTPAPCFVTAACTGALATTADIEDDDDWREYRQAALDDGFRACWSYPVISCNEELLGVVCVYYKQPSTAGTHAEFKLKQVAAMIALAWIRERDRKKHRTLHEWHSALFNNHSDGVYELDLSGRFQRGNRALERIAGYCEHELIGVHFNQLVNPDYQEKTQAAFDAACAGDAITYETRGQTGEGCDIDLEVTNFPVVIDDKIVGVWGICRDITYRKEQEAKIAYQATHDLQTGLINGSAFSERMANIFWSCQQANENLAFLDIDLDGFKSINDGLGHSVGDRLLAEVARRLQSCASRNSLIGRLVGDEFGLLIRDYQQPQAVVDVAECLLEELARPFRIGDLKLHISASIGIAGRAKGMEQPHELIQHADLALNHAKRKGRNTWQWYHGAGLKSTLDSVFLRNELQQALEKSEFVLHYQPIVDALSGKIRGVEALVRWHHPERGMISPGDFIPLAEKTGQIIPLGQWVLRQACHEIAQLNAKSDRMLPVAVNISSLQFLRENFLTAVDQALEESGLHARFLELEVTESVLLDGAEPVIALMNTLNNRGIQVAIDDFGTGFSSLSYLRDLPTHKVKLDRSFINKTLTDRRTAAIVQGVITMAHHMDMVVVAEGIETEAEQNDLVRRNCDLLQGYRFSRPVPLEVLAELPDRLPG